MFVAIPSLHLFVSFCIKFEAFVLIIIGAWKLEIVVMSKPQADTILPKCLGARRFHFRESSLLKFEDSHNMS